MSAHYKHTTALQPPNAPMEKDHFSVNVFTGDGETCNGTFKI